jgi:glycerol-3-phosphate acyltransferase PlsX
MARLRDRSKPRLPIAVDAMGGDLAPRAVVLGAVQAARRAGVAVILVGPADRLRAELARARDLADLPITVVDAPDAVAMHESPLLALRRKPRASIKVAARLVADGRAAALFSAGHTGATFLTAHAAFGVLAGVLRPALAVTVPTRTGSAILLDVGANLECRPAHLIQFGVMGSAYARVALDLADPRVGLLSIGEEAGKGNELIKKAHAGLSAAPLHFIGNIDARDLFSGRADVVVCDGFTGNIALKVGEGLIETIVPVMREALGAGFSRLLSSGALASFRRRVDYAEHGAAPLLGVGALTLVGHGRSSARAVRNGITLAARLADARVVERLAQAMGAK